jgi:hypothetical protein
MGKAPNPYVGPVPFERDDERPFYGRDGDLRRLAIQFIAKRIVLLYSPSGAGKTSLVQARLIPALEDEGFEVLPVIRLGRRLGEQGEDGPGPANIFLRNTITALDDGRESVENYSSLADYLTTRRSDPQDLGDKPAVLFFDQFEEVLTVDPHKPEQKEEFFDQLGEVLEKDDRLWALCAIREDYLAELDPYRHLIPGKLNSSYRLELLNPDQAMDAIRYPARDAGVTFSEKAARKLVDQLRQVRVRRLNDQITEEMGDAVEPVQLQVVCQSLWADLAPEEGGEIGSEAIAAEGHVDQSLGDFYDKTVARIAAENGVDERDVRDWFSRDLVTEKGLRGQVMGSGDLGLSQDVIADLVDAHLVRAEERRGIQWYELAHDRLVKPVKERNEEWYRENLSQLQIRAEAWNNSGDQGLLLKGNELKEGIVWADGKELKKYEQSFLSLSRARERNRRIRIVAVVVGFLVIVGIAFGMLLLFLNAEEARGIAAADRAAAENNADLAAASEATAVIEAKQRATAQADAETQKGEAEDAQATAEAEANRADQNAAEAQLQATVASEQTAKAEAQALRAQTQALMSLSTSLLPVSRNPSRDEDARSLLMAAQALTDSLQLEQPVSARLMDEQARRLLTDRQSQPTFELLAGHDDSVWSVAFSPDGDQLASGSDDRTIRLWDLTDPEAEPIVLAGHDASVTSVAFSPDGDQLASGSDDRTIRLWRSTPSALALFLCEQAGRNFTWDEWNELQAFLPGRDYQKTCQYPVHCTVPPKDWPAEFVHERELCAADPQ